MSEVELILAKLKIVSEEQEKGMYLCDKEHSKILLDCITNLQQENERLKEDITAMNDYIGKIQKENNILKENAEHNDKVVDKAKWDEMIYKSRNEKAIDIAYEYSQIDGEHHKTWCIDQIVRALTDNNYNEFVKEYENNGEYKWNVGIAP